MGTGNAGIFSGSRYLVYHTVRIFSDYKNTYMDSKYHWCIKKRKVSTAICLGGPGAIFWMWVSAFFGMMTTYAENFLGIKYRYKDEKGQWKGGAMVYMERGLGCKPLAVAFAVCCLGASFGMGNMVQGNSMAVGLEKAFHVPAFLSGSLCMIVVAVVLTGGMKRIAIFTERLVPVMAAIYLAGAMLGLYDYSSCNIGESSAILAGWRDRWNNAYGNGVCICYSLGKGVFGRGNRIVCFCHNDWLVLFWCTDSRLSGRRKGCKGISFLLYFDYTAGMYDCSDYDLGIVRCLKRNDGSS